MAGVAGRVLVVDPWCPIDAVRELLDGTAVAVEAGARPLAGDDVVGLVVAHDEDVSGEDIARLPSLRVIATTSIGFDHLDVGAARRRGVWVANVPDYCVEEVADTTIGLVVALLRGLVSLDRSVRSGSWDYHAAGRLRRLAGTRLGVVGFGRIGRAVASRARCLGMEVRAADAQLSDVEIGRAGVAAASFEDLLPWSDCLSLHLPLTDATEWLIGEAELARMRPDAVLVNTSRGRLVDTEALVTALRRGRLAGAALDVLPVEPPGPQAPLPQAPTLIVTPHAAWYSPDAERSACEGAALAVRAVLEGGRPAYPVVEPAEARAARSERCSS